MITEETAIELAKEADLDWQRGYTLDDEADNRYHTLCNLAVAHALNTEAERLSQHATVIREQRDALKTERDDLAGSDKRLREEIGNLQDGIKHWRDEWSEVCNDNQVLINKAHDDTALLRLALEALKQIDYDSTEDGALNQVITALRERLGEKA